MPFRAPYERATFTKSRSREAIAATGERAARSASRSRRCLRSSSLSMPRAARRRSSICDSCLEMDSGVRWRPRRLGTLIASRYARTTRASSRPRVIWALCSALRTLRARLGMALALFLADTVRVGAFFAAVLTDLAFRGPGMRFRVSLCQRRVQVHPLVHRSLGLDCRSAVCPAPRTCTCRSQRGASSRNRGGAGAAPTRT